ncbi:DUF3857 domain-containing protein [Luteolibacter yonseiensis]|uniref:DUF3857 domain-containing protein n=1 Tax=Luteolibacter yonseiensis TaxID=1144680 RepID=A0A934R2L2_9BACT|nr:DUF3857 domain-containing protein [Luteolibacter yonseiensis]MBK1814948.1 DUF3857 domain-containing protein [Luteolibacter yonseiensis]
MNFWNFLAVSGKSASEQIGQATGSGIVVLMLLAGILKCVSLLRRPTVSKPCVLALMVLLCGWTLSCVQVGLEAFEVGSNLSRVLVGFGLCVCWLAALVLGIVGLALYDSTRFRQGRAQAIWAISLASILLLATAGIVVSGALKSADDGWEGFREAGAVDTGNVPIRNTDFNFSLTPAKGWVRVKPDAINKLACLALRKSNPEVFSMVIAEKIPSAPDLEQLREIVKSNLAMNVEVISQTEDTVVTPEGLTFAHLSTQARVQSAVFNYEHWITTRRGFSWQMVSWNKGDKAGLARDARSLMETFRILDPALDAVGKGTVADVKRPELGYRTGLDGLGWAPWTTGGVNALVDFRALRGNEALVVLPLRFDVDPPDLDALTRGLLSAFQLEKSGDGNSVKPWSPGHGGTGREIRMERTVDGEQYRYILRVARGRRGAHLLAGWAAAGKGDLDLVSRSLDAITLGEPEGDAPPLAPDQKKALGLILNEAALSLANRSEREAAAAWFCKAFEEGGDPTVLGNAGDAFERLGQAVKGCAFLAPHVGKFPDNHYVALRYARLLALNGDMKEAEEAFLKLVEKGLRDENDLLSWLQLLNGRGQHVPALRCVDAWLVKNPSVNARRWQAQTHSSGGDGAKAIEMLEKLRAENPDDKNVGLDLGTEYNEAGENAKAAAIAEKLLDGGDESSRALCVLGWSQMGRHWYRDAKASFERAAKLAPDDTSIQDYIRRASAALGQGDNSEVKNEIPAVEIPAGVVAALAAKPPAAEFGEGHPCAWLLRATGYHFEKGKPLRRTIHRRVKVLTTEGAADMSSVTATFDPIHERIFMNRLEVRNAAGEVLAKASVDDAYVKEGGDEATHEKTLHLQVAAVQPGTTVEWQITIEDRSPSDRFRFNRHLFASGFPSAGEVVFVTGDVSAVRSELTNGGSIRTILDDRLAAWICGEMQAAEFEPYSIPVEQRCPMLWIGGSEGSWETVGRDYLKDLDDRLRVDKTLEDLARSLVKEKTGERDKIAAITSYVQKEISYKAIEFGIRGRRPNPADETLRSRYGDCKDTSVLAHLLLRAAGVESHLAVVNTDWETHPDLPTLDQFNHIVLLVPSLGKNWLLDPTDKTLDLASFPADNLWHSRALVLDPAGPRLIDRPAPAPKGSADVSSRRTVMVRNEDLHLEETLELTGYYASWMRGSFTGLSPAEQTRKAQGILGEGAAQLHGFRFENLDRVGEPARLVMDYDVREAISTENGRCTAVVPALWERDYLATKFVKDRKTEFETFYPLHFTSEVTAKIPMPPEKQGVVSSPRNKSTDHCEWSLNTEPAGDGVKVTFDFVAHPGHRPAASYGAFHEAWSSAGRAWDKPLGWVPR